MTHSDMRTTMKYFKDRNFEGKSNIGFDLRVDDMKKVNLWTDEQKQEAIEFLEKCKKDVEFAIKRIVNSKS